VKATTGVVCEACGNEYSIEFADAVDLGDSPHLRDRLLSGTLNFALCPHCGTSTPIDFAFLVLDPAAGRTIFFVPEGQHATVDAEILRNHLTIYQAGESEPYLRNVVQVRERDELVVLLADSPSTSEIPRALVAWLDEVRTAPSWEAKGEVIRLHPETLETRCLLFLTLFAGRYRSEQPRAHAEALLTRTLLERCRSRGIADAVAELGGRAPLDTNGNLSSVEGMEGLREMYWDELWHVFDVSDESDPLAMRYVVARVEEGLATLRDPGVNARLHLGAGIAWRRLVETDGAAVAGNAALRHLQAGLRSVDSTVDATTASSLHNELGLVLLELPGGDRHGQLIDAVAAFEAALRLRSREAMPLEWAASMNNLAIALTRFDTHDWVRRAEESIDHFNAALEVLAAQGARTDAFRAYLDLGSAYARLHAIHEGYDDRAVEAYATALALATADVPAREQAACLLARAYALRRKGLRSDARRDAHRALELIASSSAGALAATAHEIIGDTLLPGASTPATDALNEAITHYRRASEAVGVNEEPDLRRRIDRALGDAYLLSGDYEAARGCYGFALAAHETLYRSAEEETSRLQESGSVAGLYDRDSYVHFKTGLFERGLLRLEAGRARWITSELALAHVELGLLAPESREHFTALREQIAALEVESRSKPLGLDETRRQELGEATQRMREFLTNIQANNRDALPQALSVAELAATAPVGGALVYLVVTPAGGVALIVPHEGDALDASNLVWLDGLTTAAVDRALLGKGGWFESYRSSLSRRKRAISEVGSWLWQIAMGPLHHRLNGLGLGAGAHVVIVPPGKLALLPLHAAWRTDSGEQCSFADHWTVSYVPSGFSLSISARRARAPAGEGMLVVANPTRDLAGATKEADAIAALTPVTRIGSDATRQALVQALPGKEYVHFACHGTYDWEDPLQSGLLLADGTRFTLADVLGSSNLTPARLITLSACETALIDVANSPDDYVGLPAGFLQAGAAAVLSTLWPIADEPTVALVKSFYEAHLVHGAPPTIALRTASLQLRKLRPDPFYWAAFTLTGV
jgi:tetratricopeptide (TPR) repeat protein